MTAARGRALVCGLPRERGCAAHTARPCCSASFWTRSTRGQGSLRRWLCTDAETSTLPPGPYFPARSAVTGQRANDSPSTCASRCAACFSRQVQSHIPSGTHTKPHMRLRFARLRFRGLAPNEKGHEHVELPLLPHPCRVRRAEHSAHTQRATYSVPHPRSAYRQVTPPPVT